MEYSVFQRMVQHIAIGHAIGISGARTFAGLAGFPERDGGSLRVPFLAMRGYAIRLQCAGGGGLCDSRARDFAPIHREADRSHV